MFNEIVAAEGPLSRYRAKLCDLLDRAAQFDQYRHFLAHGLMVAMSKDHIQFEMYNYRKDVPVKGSLTLSFDNLKDAKSKIAPLGQDFLTLVRGIITDIPLPVV